MAPDVEELIRRVNTLTLDKTKLKQRLVQLTNTNTKLNDSANAHQLLTTLSSSSSVDSSIDRATTTSHNGSPPTDICVTPAESKKPQSNSKDCSNVSLISGVECITSCEEDLIYANDLYRKRIDEYSSNWSLLQSKCSALLSELNALQKHYAILKREKQATDIKLANKCDDYDKLKSELQTVVLNYETQLGAMSEHLSTITSQLTDENTMHSKQISK